MPAGRELDTLVAKKVMGWVYREYWGQLVPSEQLDAPMWSEWAQDETGDVCRHPINRLSNIPYRGDKPWIPEYSTEIDAAWKVVEKMQKDGFYFELSHDLCAWTAIFQHADSGKVIHVNTTKSNAPEEICRAALLAVSE